MNPLNCADKKRKCAAPFSWLKRLKGTDPVNSKQNLSELKATLLRKDLAIRDDAFKKAEKYIDNASKCGGADAFISHTFRVEGTRHERVDLGLKGTDPFNYTTTFRQMIDPNFMGGAVKQMHLVRLRLSTMSGVRMIYEPLCKEEPQRHFETTESRLFFAIRVFL